MTSFDVGIQSSLKRIAKQKSKMLTTITQAKRNLVSAAFQDVVRLTPQFSGNLASNWKIEVHGVPSSYKRISNYRVRDWRRTPKQYEMGDDPAVSRSNKELAKLSTIKWNSRVSIVNNTPYAQEIQDAPGNGIKIRPVNLLGGEVAMANYVRMKYKTMRISKLIKTVS